MCITSTKLGLMCLAQESRFDIGMPQGLGLLPAVIVVSDWSDPGLVSSSSTSSISDCLRRRFDLKGRVGADCVCSAAMVI